MHYCNISQEAMDRIQYSYSDILTFTDVYFHISEFLSGHEEEATANIFKHHHYYPPFDYHSCHVLVTGLPQHVYHDIYEWGQRDSVCCFIYEYRPRVRGILNRYGYDGESYIFLFDGKKHYVTIFSQIQETADDILPLAQEINDCLQQLYEQYLFDAPSEYSNFTAVSPRIISYNEVSTAFFRTKDYLALHYFHRESIAIDDAWVQAHRHPLMHLEYDEQIAKLKDTLYAANLDDTLATLHTLFFGLILPTLSFDELDSFLLTVRNILFSYATVCGYPAPIDENMFQYKQYPHLWACHHAISAQIQQLVAFVQQEKRSYSTITIDAILYMRTHYGSNIYIDSIAGAIHTAPNYLSHVFKKDTGTTIHQYLTDVRIEKAKKLLTASDARLHEIAVEVGFATSKYFASVFRKNVGMTPADYRKAQRENS